MCFRATPWNSKSPKALNPALLKNLPKLPPASLSPSALLNIPTPLKALSNLQSYWGLIRSYTGTVAQRSVDLTQKAKANTLLNLINPLGEHSENSLSKPPKKPTPLLCHRLAASASPHLQRFAHLPPRRRQGTGPARRLGRFGHQKESIVDNKVPFNAPV